MMITVLKKLSGRGKIKSAGVPKNDRLWCSGRGSKSGQRKIKGKNY
jgi:hypothetical protein